MCGLAGVFNPKGLTPKQKRMFDDLMNISSLRGYDSTGMTAGLLRPKKPTQIVTLRGVETSAQFINSKHYNDIMTRNVSFILGHTRAATIGDVDLANCQPVTHNDNIFMTHNGTIHSLAHQAKTRKMSDSLILVEKLSSKSLDETLKDCAGGAWALVIANVLEETITITRNDKRSLYFMSYNDCLFWASEALFLEFVCERHGVKAEDYKIETVPEDTVFTFDMDQHPSTVDVRELEKPCASRSNWVPSYHYDTQGEKFDYQKYYSDKEKAKREADKLKAAVRSEQATKEPLKLPAPKAEPTIIGPVGKEGGVGFDEAWYIGYAGAIIKKEEAEKLLAYGCIMNGDPHGLTDEVYWINETQYVSAGAKEKSLQFLMTMYPGIKFYQSSYFPEKHKDQIICN